MTNYEQYVPIEEDFIDSWACAHVTPHDMTAEESKDAARAFLARVRRDAAQEALNGLIADKAHMTVLLHAENGGNVEDVLTHYRDTHYPEETP